MLTCYATSLLITDSFRGDHPSMSTVFQVAFSHIKTSKGRILHTSPRTCRCRHLIPACHYPKVKKSQPSCPAEMTTGNLFFVVVPNALIHIMTHRLTTIPRLFFSLKKPSSSLIYFFFSLIFILNVVYVCLPDKEEVLQKCAHYLVSFD